MHCISNDSIHSEIFLFWFRAECELDVASYSSKHASWPLSNVSFSIYFNQRKSDAVIEHVIVCAIESG